MAIFRDRKLREVADAADGGGGRRGMPAARGIRWQYPFRMPPSIALVIGLLVSTPAGAEPLPEILVIDQRDENHRRHALKLPVPADELPISSETFDREHIARTPYSEIGDLLALSSSALTVSAEGGVTNDVMVRGFGNTPFYRNGLNDSLGQLAPRSLANVSRIEILRGPNAALFGPGEPGGTVNYVTKRPERAPDGAVDGAGPIRHDPIHTGLDGPSPRRR